MGDVRAALDAAVAAASHLDDGLDAAAVEAARALADKIDAWDVIVEWAKEDAEEAASGRPTVPQNDNVSLPSFLKYLDALGLTPAARHVLEEKKGGAGGKLRALREGERARASSGERDSKDLHSTAA